MDSIENFLLARIAEDEAVVGGVAEPIRSRMLAHLSALRRAVAIRVAANNAHPESQVASGYERALWDMLTVLALPYADHPDYTAWFRPSDRVAVQPESGRLLALRPLEGRIARSEPEQRAYYDVAINLAQAVVVQDPQTPAQWVEISIGVIGTAWSNEMNTTIILSRALLAMTRLAVDEAELLAASRSDQARTAGDVAETLASMSTSTEPT